jgi:hypothetical protein
MTQAKTLERLITRMVLQPCRQKSKKVRAFMQPFLPLSYFRGKTEEANLVAFSSEAALSTCPMPREPRETD